MSDSNPSVLSPAPGRRWCALRTKARHEKKVARACAALGVPAYLPLASSLTLQPSSRRLSEALVPIFPGYVFAALSGGDLRQLKTTNSIAHAIDAGCQERLLGSLRSVAAAVTSQCELALAPVLEAGERVVVVRGPLRGAKGQVVRHKNRTRIWIAVDLIGRALVVDVSRDDLRPISPPLFAA